MVVVFVCFGDEVFEFFFVRDVVRNGDGVVFCCVNVFCDGVVGVCFMVWDDDFGVVCCEFFGYGFVDVFGWVGDEGDIVVEIEEVFYGEFFCGMRCWMVYRIVGEYFMYWLWMGEVFGIRFFFLCYWMVIFFGIFSGCFFLCFFLFLFFLKSFF